MENTKLKVLILIVFGFFIGFVNGFLGGGGGVLVVMVLLWLCKLEQKNAHATALIVILPISIVSAIVYLLNGSGDWEKIIYSTIGVIFGGLLGAVLLNKLKGEVTKLIFSAILMIAGVRMFL